MNKINIFWIEDNPKLEDVTIDRFEKRSLPNKDLFSISLFQHPIEVLEYIKLNSQLKSDGSHKSIAEKCSDVIPDIIVFDYKLSDNFIGNHPGSFYYRKPKELEFLKRKSASIKLKAHFKALEGQTLFLEREDVAEGELDNELLDFDYLSFSKFQGMNDEFGLYCGITLLKEFEDSITHAIPSTKNFNDKELLSATSKFYEWINSARDNYALNEKNVESKLWRDILGAALPQLRKRINFQITQGKIIPNITQLMRFANGNTDEGFFEFSSAYGFRKLPLAGLFADALKAQEKAESIVRFAKTILFNYKNAKVYSDAVKSSETLINGYRNKVVVDNRLKLSELTVKSCNGQKLTASEKKELDNLLTEFGIGKVQLKNAIDNKRADTQNIKNHVVDFRQEKSDNDLQLNRLIVLFTDLRMHLHWQTFCLKTRSSKMSYEAAQIISLLNGRPTIADLRAALFPIPLNPLVLPYHRHLLVDKKFKRKDPFETWDTPVGEHMGDHAILSKTEYPMNLSGGEVKLGECFAVEIGLKTEFWPKWLMREKYD